MATIASLRKKYLSGLPAWEADSLLGLSCQKDKTFILTNPDYRLSVRQLVFFYYNFFQFKKGVPLAYITKTKEFFGLNFFVNKHTLIPRPDTEIMVEEAIKFLNTQDRYILIDVGTGTSCIPISILKKSPRLPRETIAVDISKGALRAAVRNSKTHGVDIKFIHGNLLEPVIKFIKEKMDTNFIITANLPYLTEKQFTEEASIQHEPKSALVAGEGGLALYRELILQIKTSGIRGKILLEINPEQTKNIKQIIHSLLPDSEIEIKTDLAGRDRLVVIKIN